MADLIGVHFLNKRQQQAIISNQAGLASVLGTQDEQHPSGTKRVRLMVNYIKRLKDKTTAEKEAIFRREFTKIWMLKVPNALSTYVGETHQSFR